ncbi:hypothetical protein [Hymenobacter swuensis]|uniref:Uncharacterized protein n=1 Tax=Hymenobacter swuensis DY53 TaxID=1227739 RepID=W8F783_9BACT|nr:hypothetical protein [Hymenobacter swuensis]AHJ98451.1 hypothetical protein Hsw_2856 [Hymenobacter swuensis DY53]
MDNQQIAHYLQQQRDTALTSFQAVTTMHPRIRACFATLQAFDFAAYRQQLHGEILRNLAQWQILAKPEEALQPLDALLFEFNSIYEYAEQADAYGIVDWQDAAPHIEGFDMGYKHDFRKGFEAVPGMSLSFLKPLEVLLDPGTIDELVDDEQDMEEVPGFQPLADAYLFSGLAVVHDVLAELNQQNHFAGIGLKPAAQILLGGHDTGIVYPLLFTASK